MSDELLIEGIASSHQLNNPADPLACPPCSSTDNTAGAATDSSSHSGNDSGPSTPTHENLPETMSGTAEVKPLRPYAIEEPDDDPEPPVHWTRALPCLPDYFELWQRELIDRIDDMDDKAVTSPGAKLSPILKRGQKRKPIGAPNAGDSHLRSHRFKSKAKPDDPALPVNGLSPKRRRRRSKILEDSAKHPHTVSLHDFRETRVNESSGSDLLSSSSIDTATESALADEMDID
jgi:hypothetical protein